jgi:hypothetical protein
MDKDNTIGVVVGNTTTDSYSFILTSMKGSKGDLVYTEADIPASETNKPSRKVFVWGRILSINRTNTAFPSEIAQEIAKEQIEIRETLASTDNEYQEAEVEILGQCDEKDTKDKQISLRPLNYPVMPSAQVKTPDEVLVKKLLSGDSQNEKTIHIGSLISRNDIAINVSASKIVARHMAILAMTGGGKTVAARRIIKGLSDYGYPMLIFDPHGDYLGLFSNREKLENNEDGSKIDVKIFQPALMAKGHDEVVEMITTLFTKFDLTLSSAQTDKFYEFIESNEAKKAFGDPHGTGSVQVFDSKDIQEHLRAFKDIVRKELESETNKTTKRTIGAVLRTINQLIREIAAMQKTNQQLAKRLKSRDQSFEFENMPNLTTDPDEVVRSNRISIFYLGGFSRLLQSMIVSITLETLFKNRASLDDDRIGPFASIVEEAHNFVPGSGEEKKSTPSLLTIRKLLTEGRKFGTGVILISQRPNRLDETTLAQCNSFLILKLVNPRDQSWVQRVMEQMSNQDREALKAFANGQAFISGHAVKFPLQVQVKRDKDLETSIMGDEDFMNENKRHHKKTGANIKKRDKNSESISSIAKSAKKAKTKL